MTDFLKTAIAGQIALAARAAATSSAAQSLQLDSATVFTQTLDSAAAFDEQLIKRESISVVNEWATTSPDDLDAGESMADRLMNMLVGVVDADKDGELSDDEQESVNVGLNATFDYLVTLGVNEDDAAALLSDWPEDVANRVRDFVAGALPDGEDAENQLIDALVFTPEDQAPVFDSANGLQLDAAYRKVVAIRSGKKVRINKRIAGVVKLSARQKVALRKARTKAHSASAMASRRRSMRLRRSMGMSRQASA